MIRISEIQEKFLHLIGWEQNISNNGPKVDAALTKSETGMTYQQAHPLITLDNLSSLAPDFKNEFPYNFKKNYSHGNIAYCDGKFYACKKPVSNISPNGEVYSDSKDLHDYKNYLTNSSFEAFDINNETLDIEFDGWSKNESAVKISVTPDSHCGEHAIVLRTRKGTSRLQSDWVHLEPGNYIVSIYAKRIESLDTENPNYENSAALIGVRFEEENKIDYKYADTYTNIDESWVKLEYNFTIEESKQASLVVRLKETLASEAFVFAFDCAAIRDADVVITSVPTTPYIVGIRSDAADYWRECNPLSDWIISKVKASITKMVSRFLNEKLAKSASKNIIENKVLFDGTGRLCDTIENRDRYVGFEVIPVRAKGITTKINKIGLHFTEPGTYKIYIYHSSCEEPVYAFEFEKTKANSCEWFSLEDVLLPYESANIDAGGSWFICYKQNELPENSKAINKNYDWSKGPCTSCSRREAELYKAWSRWLEIHPFHSAMRKPDIAACTSYNNICVDPETTSFKRIFGNSKIGLILWSSVYSAESQEEIKVFHNQFIANAAELFGVDIADIRATARGYSTTPRRGYSTTTTGFLESKSKYKTIEQLITAANKLEIRITPNDIRPETYKQPFELKVVHEYGLIPENNVYTYDKNYGINLDLTVSCDLTDFIIEQRGIFQDVLLKQFGVDMLKEFAYNSNVRTNRHVINASRTDILYELDGDSSSMKKSGLSYQLDEAYKALQISTQGLSRVCLPCVNNGIKYRTV